MRLTAEGHHDSEASPEAAGKAPVLHLDRPPISAFLRGEPPKLSLEKPLATQLPEAGTTISEFTHCKFYPGA